MNFKVINIGNFLVNTIGEISNVCFHSDGMNCGREHDYEATLTQFTAELNKKVKRSYWDGCLEKPKMLTGNQGSIVFMFIGIKSFF